MVVVILFIGSWLIRRSDALHHAPSTAALAFSVVAVLLAMISGWLGGELVERLGVGVAPDAGPNAPSSLRSRETEVKVPAQRPAGAMRRRSSA